jgi:hypothetical protein
MLVVSAKHINRFQVEIKFDDGYVQIIDFEHFLKNNPHPQWNKYLKLENFKKFKVESGNLVWGRDWDLIFPIEQLYSNKLVA